MNIILKCHKCEEKWGARFWPNCFVISQGLFQLLFHLLCIYFVQKCEVDPTDHQDQTPLFVAVGTLFKIWRLFWKNYPTVMQFNFELIGPYLQPYIKLIQRQCLILLRIIALLKMIDVLISILNLISVSLIWIIEIVVFFVHLVLLYFLK